MTVKLVKLANGWFSMMTGNIVPFDTIGVEIVEHSNTKLIAIPIIWLRFSFGLFTKIEQMQMNLLQRKRYYIGLI